MRKKEEKKRPYDISRAGFQRGLFIVGSGYTGSILLPYEEVPQFIADLKSALAKASLEAFSEGTAASKVLGGLC